MACTCWLVKTSAQSSSADAVALGGLRVRPVGETLPRMQRRARPPWLWAALYGALVGAAASGCGSRSALRASESVDAAAGSGGASGGASGSGGFTTGGSAGAGGASGGAGGSAGAGGVPFDCGSLAAGPATEVLSFPDRHATAPSAVTLDTMSPPRIALQAFASGGSSPLHDDIRLLRFTLDATAPAGIALELGPTLVGLDSHGWGNLSLAPPGVSGVALAWHGDPGGASRPMFRAIPAESWTPTPVANLAPPGTGEAVLALAAGAATNPGGEYGGQGYGVVWRRVGGPSGNATYPVAAVVDVAGTVVIGPHEVSPPSTYPGRSPSIVWSGSTYLLATAAKECAAGDPPCVNDAVTISRLRPKAGVELVSALGAAPGYVPARPTLSRQGDLVRVAWVERPELPGSPARVNLWTLATNGNPLVGGVLLETDSDPQSRVTSNTDAAFVALVWAESGDPSLSHDQLGRSRIELRVQDDSGAVFGAQLPSTLFHSYGPPFVVGRGALGSWLVVWGARSMTTGFDVTYAARVDCTGSR